MAILKNTTIDDTGSIKIPGGTTAQRPASPVAGMYRYNTDLSAYEYYNGTTWRTQHNEDPAANNLVLNLDASNKASYPGVGPTWYDLSGNNYNFNVTASTWNPLGFFAFGSTSIAKRATGTDLPGVSGDVTYVLLTRPLTSTTEWRTLTRSSVADHHVIIQSGAYAIGMYDNDGAAFLSSGYNQNSLAQFGTSGWVVLYFRWQTVAPHYALSYNDTPGTIRGSITNTSAQYNRGFTLLGGYSSNWTAPATSNSQRWGDIARFRVYNKRLSDEELLAVYPIISEGYYIQ
jgi:hypothetical protein